MILFRKILKILGRLKRHRKDNVSSIQQMRKLGCSRNSEGIGALCCDRRQQH
ncbi:hypothetical protein LEP1GSC096_2798 [Leptospira interrogans serovar Hebdomadis str. R499]|uniref:Uncharacterized protein n=2 Tax=Leptospira interrogans TaxID=173 RepID=A0A0E2CYS9_LEPIR|nr:hypothetical protein LEP1GSC045_1870 [Leptospira interrogans serovar Pomona str. Kennewicki LC82-25]EKO24158.1 hypothetical protein LEP1GSC104_2180 [Leptospira interrogans str. UI 12621]EKR36742.1 hypothetical protein LEP1GSC096_2798 [Leptospira interrogans serovar Hebdomadis str. R499]EKR52748.1 hypothetical protein LEP1GSC105_1927 [Leptospira interrogans str. UI 12758]EMF31538.1 hypothetical protein LEP1GSC201_1699 [Leptospira interrogans serovar Pomona str. Fox 32256]EMI64529.1 hypotheti